jgi:hypothetical protein
MLEPGSSSQIESELFCEQVFLLNMRGINRLWEPTCLAPKPLRQRLRAGRAIRALRGKLSRLRPGGDARQALQTTLRIDTMACRLLFTKGGRPRKEDLSSPVDDLGIPPE